METSTDPPTTSIIKSDRTGRTCYTQKYKQEVLDAFESSSLSAPAFARHCGVKYPTFAAWVVRRKRASCPPSDGKPTFLIAEVPDATGADDPTGLDVRLPGGALARVSDSTQIALLAELLTRLA